MPNLTWEQTSFQGIHTQPAKTADGHLYAEDMENLRIDGTGYLQLRSDAIAMEPDGISISGVATTLRHVFTLRADGRFYVREVDNLSSEIEITGVENLSGRISLVDFSTYAVLTSEGTDQGYMIDLREDKNYQNISLGLDPPDPTATTALAVSLVHEVPDGTESGGEGDLSEGTYLYSFAYLVHDSNDDALPWNNMQSNLWGVWTKTITVTPSEDVNYARVVISYPAHLDATHIRIYRAHVNDQYNLRHVADIPIQDTGGGLIFYDGYADTEIEATQKERRLSVQNLIVNRLEEKFHRLPAEAKQIFEYNDRIFAPAGDRLVYSDVDFGNIVPWAFPKENDIRVQGSVDFCGEINEVLLFGSRDGLWRLAGNTEYNFAIGQISNSGPIDGYAWSKITDALAFVGEGGLFVTDASAVVRASETVLDGFFQDKKVVRGAVAFFKDGDILYAVTLEDREGNTADVQFKREDGYWVRWNLPFMQSATIVAGNKATLVLVADGTGQLKRLDWNSTANEEADVAWSWTSQFLDEPGPGLANRRKRYSQFQWTGEAANTMLLQVWKDNESEPAVEKTFESRANLIPVRVPINRIARRLRFKLSGTGRVKIQGMRVVIGI